MKQWQIHLPNGNDLLYALQKSSRKNIRRRCRAVADFVDHETWFSWPEEGRRKHSLRGTLSTKNGLYLSAAQVWVKFRAHPDSGDLEMNAGRGWIPFLWGLDPFVIEMDI